MPQVDLQTLFRGGSGRKVICETLIETVPDIPAYSFRLPIQDEIDWVDRNAVFERKQSTKGIPNLTISHTNSTSKRFYPNLKSKALIIGLPKRPDSGELCRPSLRRCRPPSIRFFPKPVSKQAVAETEPASPKVSCIGRVRSKRGKDNRRQWRSQENPPVSAKSARKNLGFWARIVAVFHCERKVAIEESESAEGSSSPGKNIPSAMCQIPTAEAEAPKLGGLKKFASGRRSESWSSVELEMDLHVAESKPW